MNQKQPEAAIQPLQRTLFRNTVLENSPKERHGEGLYLPDRALLLLPIRVYQSGLRNVAC